MNPTNNSIESIGNNDTQGMGLVNPSLNNSQNVGAPGEANLVSSVVGNSYSNLNPGQYMNQGGSVNDSNLINNQYGGQTYPGAMGTQPEVSAGGPGQTYQPNNQSQSHFQMSQGQRTGQGSGGL